MAKQAETQKLSKYETARILGARALQLSEGAKLSIELSEKDLEALNYDVIRIAKLELEKGKIPLEIIKQEKKSELGEEVLKAEAELLNLERENNLNVFDKDDDDSSDSSDD